MASKLCFTVATIVVVASAIFSVCRFGFSFEDHKISQLEVFPIDGAVGPETFAFDPLGGGPYTGVSDGRIIKWMENQRQFTDFAITSSNRNGCYGEHDWMEHICGRPLGLRFYVKTGDLYIADAYLGLLVVGRDGGLATRLANEAQGISFGFTNSLDIDQQTGIVYFTDSSSEFNRRNYLSVTLSGDKTGRLMKYEPESKRVVVLLNNLSFPNGVVLSKNSEFILLVETSKCRIMRYWLKTAKSGTLEVFALLPGFPDNIKRSPRGGFWVGINSKREKISEWVLSYPWIGKVLIQFPINVMKLHSYLAKWKASGLGLRLNENGHVIQVLKLEKWWSISEVDEKDGNLWIGSVNLPFAGMYKI